MISEQLLQVGPQLQVVDGDQHLRPDTAAVRQAVGPVHRQRGGEGGDDPVQVALTRRPRFRSGARLVVALRAPSASVLVQRQLILTILRRARVVRRVRHGAQDLVLQLIGVDQPLVQTVPRPHVEHALVVLLLRLRGFRAIWVHHGLDPLRPPCDQTAEAVRIQHCGLLGQGSLAVQDQLLRHSCIHSGQTSLLTGLGQRLGHQVHAGHADASRARCPTQDGQRGRQHLPRGGS